MAPAMRERRRPKHPVHPAMRSKSSDASVIQNPEYYPRVSHGERKKGVSVAVPGPATVRTCTSGRRCTLSCTIVYSAMSIANAMRVRRAAMKERNDANKASVTCDERDNRRAIKVTPVAAVRKTHQFFFSERSRP